MKRILLLILIIIISLFLVDILMVYISTNIEYKNIKIEKEDKFIDEVLNISNEEIEKELVNTWYNVITDGKSIILKDILYINKNIYAFGINEKENKNIIIIKLDNDGNILFQKEIKVSSSTNIYSVENINNNFYILGIQENKPIIYVINYYGELLKSRKFENYGEFFKIIKDDYESIYVLGYIKDDNKKIGVLMEINKDLDILNEFKVNWYNNEEIYDLISDKNYIYLLGNTNSTANNNYNIFVIKLNKLNYNDYTIQKYGTDILNEIGYSLLYDENNFYIVGYSSTINNFPWKLLIIKTDNNLNEIQRKDYLLKKSARGLSANVSRNNLIISGYSLEQNNDFDGFISIVNKSDLINIKDIYYGKEFDERLLKSKIINNNVIVSVGYQKNNEIISGIILYTDIDGNLKGFIK